MQGRTTLGRVENMRLKWSRVSSAVVTGLVLCLLPGCWVATFHLSLAAVRAAETAGEPADPSWGRVRFWHVTAAGWEDVNNDNAVTASEVRTLKRRFRKSLDEQVFFAVKVSDREGAQVNLVLCAPRGKEYDTYDCGLVGGSSAVMHQSVSVAEMIDRAGTGIWKYRWLVDRNPVCEREFTLAR